VDHPARAGGHAARVPWPAARPGPHVLVPHAGARRARPLPRRGPPGPRAPAHPVNAATPARSNRAGVCPGPYPPRPNAPAGGGPGSVGDRTPDPRVRTHNPEENPMADQSAAERLAKAEGAIEALRSAAEEMRVGIAVGA